MRQRFLRALRGEEVDARPIWLMRQAGRYLPGYQRLRAEHPILEIARTPALAAEVTLEPVRAFDVDAGVVYADISLPFAGLGVDFTLEPGRGPVVARPLRRREAIEGLRDFDVERELGFVGEAVRAFHDAGTDRPIVGFAGGPFTLAAYLVEGGPSRDYAATKQLLFTDPEAFDRLIDRLTETTIEYLRMQSRAGADALQLFDTWVGAVSERTFVDHLQAPLERIFAELRSTGRPTIYFSTGSSHLLPHLGRLGASALGVDWREPLASVRARVPREVALQGNLDPGALLGAPERLAEEARALLRQLPDGRGHVFNLGHGVLPGTDPERVRELVELVHREGAAGGGP